MRFLFVPGLRGEPFRNVRLTGSWDDKGRYSDAWSTVEMEAIPWEDGAVAYRASVDLDPRDADRQFGWSVLVDGVDVRDASAVITEAKPEGGDASNGPRLQRLFVPSKSGDVEQYYLCLSRRLGAQKVYRAVETATEADPRAKGEASLRFSVWAPHAEAVEVVFADRSRGYIANDGSGIDPGRPVIALARRDDGSGVWQSADDEPHLKRFADWVGVPYMYRVRKEGGAIAYRTDVYSRAQIGAGATNPAGKPWDGSPSDLDGVVSCSLVVDPDRVTAEPVAQSEAGSAPTVTEEEFWADELRHERPVHRRLEDLVIYELHVGSLGWDKPTPGTLADAIALLDYVQELGANAIELLPIAQFAGNSTWGYGNSHHFAIHSGLGGRDLFKHFVRECHRRGIAVIVDVVYNHYVHDAERAQWRFDSDVDEHNGYYWYEGRSSDYSDPAGGYVDNMSTGFAPRFSDEMVRRMFISSALALIDEFHVDGLRVDQTTSIHSYNVLHADGRGVGAANQAGGQFLRELGRALKLVRPVTLLIAEDHSGWAMVKEPAEFVGLGFDAAWYADYYHHLIGDTDKGEDYAKLLAVAGQGSDVPLRMDYFAGAMGATGRGTVVYHESHDEAGNSAESKRTLCVALNLPAGAAPEEKYRHFAESRTRVVAAMTFFSAGTPMFLFGEEVGAVQPFLYADFLQHREDLRALKEGTGARLYEFYKDAIRLRLRFPGLRSPNIEVVHADNDRRAIAFRRFHGAEEFLVIGTLANATTAEHTLEHPSLGSASWREVFNSDDARYGGEGAGNPEPRQSQDGRLVVTLPARTVLVLRRNAS